MALPPHPPPPPPPTASTSADSSGQDFSLVLGGPLYQLWRCTRIAGESPRALLVRRVVVITAIAWVPLLVLSFISGRAWEGQAGVSVDLPFIEDVKLHARMLLALPIMIVAELLVHQRMMPIVGRFKQRGIVPESGEAAAGFDAAVKSALKLRNSVTAEVVLLVLVYTVGFGFLWLNQQAPDKSTWYFVGGAGEAGSQRPTAAGWWVGLVSVPLMQFILLRWYFRLFVWGRFLWHVSKLELNLIPTHPDRCCGLGFLGRTSYAFAPVLFAQGCILAGFVAGQIFHQGATLPGAKIEIAVVVACIVAAVLTPLTVFDRRLRSVKRKGLAEYGNLAQRYVGEFDNKWIRKSPPPSADEQLLGSADIQSLADLGGGYEMVTSMRTVPFSFKTVLHMAAVSLLPLAPLLLTIMSPDEILQRLLKMVV